MDIAIAGMGMGGLCLANFLARDGHNVTLYDQMKQPAPVGSGFVVQPTGLMVLEQLGLRDVVENSGQRIDRMLGKLCHTQKTVLDVGYQKGAYGIAIIRWVLFDILLQQAISLGVAIESNKRVCQVETGASPRLVFANGQKSASYDLVVDAAGASSPLRQVKSKALSYGALWLNVPWQADQGFALNTLEQRYHKASHMIGLLPLGRASPTAQAMTTLFWSIKHCNVAAWKQAGIAQWRDEIVKLWPQAQPFIDTIADDEDKVVHAQYCHHTYLNPSQQGFTRIGDAYHATSPQLGQGANMAFLDAFALSTALSRHKNLADGLFSD